MSAQTLDLFQWGSLTSRRAAESIRPSRDRMRTMVLDHIRKVGGCTDEEIADALAMAPNTARPRRVELVTAGLVVDSGTTRRTRSGRSATVWRAVSR